MLGDDIKFSTAWAEINARIQAREMVWSGFTAVAFTLVGIAGSSNGYRFLGIAPGYLALATVCFSRHHDMIIRLLAEFQREVEKSSSKPRWVTDGWSDKASLKRNWRDTPQVAIVILSALFGLWLAGGVISWGPQFPDFWAFVGSLVSALLAVILLLVTHFHRREPLQLTNPGK